LGVMSRIYVVSLPHRADRRVQMDQLERALGLNWTYVDAIDADDPLIANVMDQVRTLRNNVPTFSWPENIDSQASSDALLEPAGSDIWTLSALFGPLEPYFPGETPERFSPSARLQDPTRQPSDPPPDLACTADNDLLAPLAPEHPAHMLLTPARIACWHSHLQVIRAIANGNDDGPALVLEDDIDMEWDTQARLAALWSALPAAWDIVYLGHCWSDETQLPALRRGPSASLHPSAAPKCTHAYALSRRGARRALLHLRHPPFAYSRAIDQALAWLVRSGRLRAFSVVPPVVVQRKDSSSDVMPGRGSEWRQGLDNG
ncbi:hypothetical protein HETIRDRAFT_240238, partial [Heterobasidion irregulare TC 32-1]